MRVIWVGIAVRFDVMPIGDSAREFESGRASERETQHPKPRGIGMLPESWVGERGIECELDLERPEKHGGLAIKRALKWCYYNESRSREES